MANEPTAAAAGTISIGGELKANRLGFGAMRITGDGIWGPPDDHDGAIRVLRRAMELGVDFIDTADSYGPEVSEDLIREALSPYPDGLVIATKGGLLRTGPGQWPSDGRPEHLRSALDGSLRRLGVEQIALYQFHRPDPRVPFEDSVGTLAELRDQGKIRHIGLSNVDADQIRRASAITPIVSVQNRYNVTDRSSEAVVDLCEQERLAFLPWAPILDLDRTPAVQEIADRHGATPRQVALAWLLARSPAMLPIPGTSSVAHLEDNVGAAGLQLAPEEVDAMIPPRPGR
jgi:pyridoxine 4-dehydrogenase